MNADQVKLIGALLSTALGLIASGTQIVEKIRQVHADYTAKGVPIPDAVLQAIAADTRAMSADVGAKLDAAEAAS